MSATMIRFAILAATTSVIACGCATWTGSNQPARLATTPAHASRAVTLAAPKPAVLQVAHREDPPAKLPDPVLPAAPSPRRLDGATTLGAAEVVRVVLERNPTLDQMRATAAAVAARYPQVISLDDPTFGFSTAAGSIGSPNADYAARVEVAQKFLYPGKRTLKGSAAKAEAIAAAEDIEDARLQLTEAAVSALADYYLAAKAREVATANLERLKSFHKEAANRYKNGQGPQRRSGSVHPRTSSLQRGRSPRGRRVFFPRHQPAPRCRAGVPLPRVRAAGAGRPRARAQ